MDYCHTNNSELSSLPHNPSNFPPLPLMHICVNDPKPSLNQPLWLISLFFSDLLQIHFLPKHKAGWPLGAPPLCNSLASCPSSSSTTMP